MYKQLINITLYSLLIFYSCSPQNTSYTSSSGKNIKLTENQQEKKEKILEEAKKQSVLLKLEDARKEYLKALKIDPNCDACYYEMANLYFRVNYIKDAQYFSNKAYQLDSTNIWYQLQLAQLAALNSNYSLAERLYTYLLKENPDKVDIYYSLASIYEKNRKFEQALNMYDSAQNRFGYNENVAVRKQEIYSALGEYSKSIKEAQTLLEYEPDNPQFIALLGDAYAQALNDSLALNAYNKTLAIQPDYPPALLGKAEIARKSGKFNEYFDNLNNYYNSDKIGEKDKIEYLSLVLSIPTFAEYFKKELDNLFKILDSKYPSNKDLKYLQSSYYMQTSRKDSAIKLLNNILLSDISDYRAWNQKLSIEYSLMQWDDLKKTSQKAIKIYPTSPPLYMYRGFANWQLKELNSAASDFEQAIKLGKDEQSFTTQVYAFLGDLYHQMGKDKQSFQCYENVLKVDSTNATVLNNYAYFLAIKGKKLDMAYKMSKKAIELESNNVSFLDTFGWILYLQGKLTESLAIFRQAIIAGGKDNAVILDHYADVLYALEEFDTASIYWSQALEKPDCENKKEIQQKLQKINKK